MNIPYGAIYGRIKTGRISNLAELRGAIYQMYDLKPCPGWTTVWDAALEAVDDTNDLYQILCEMDDWIDSIQDIRERGFR